MSLQEVRIDERTWAGADEARRLEWRATLNEMTQADEMVVANGIERLDVQMTQQGFRIEGRRRGAAPHVHVDIAHYRLRDLVTEYVDVVREIALADSMMRLEALDMAKKATHDRAGRLVKRECRDLGLDLPSARRLFTLLLGLRVDTTRLMGVHGHRTIR